MSELLFDDQDPYRDKTQSVACTPLDVAESSERTAAFIVISGRAFGRSFKLDPEESTIGRSPRCNIRLDDDGISRIHASVVRAEGEWVLLDLKSTNGTYHDGERIQAHTLKDGDKVQIGLGTVLRFQHQDVMDEQYQRSMYESKTRDALTRAYNRGYFMESIEREVAFALRHQQTLSLILFDIDHFKVVNDNYGHTAGDYALKAVATEVHDRIRKEDIFARYGGEEFAVLLRDTSTEMAFILAERMRRSIEKLSIEHAGRKIPCTISLGIASTGDRIRSPNALIDAADERLYRAKAGGRNRTEAALFD